MTSGSEDRALPLASSWVGSLLQPHTLEVHTWALSLKKVYLDGNREPWKDFKQGSDFIRFVLEENCLVPFAGRRQGSRLYETPVPPHRNGVEQSDPPWQCENPIGPAALWQGPTRSRELAPPLLAQPLEGMPAEHPGRPVSSSEHGLQSQPAWFQFPALPLPRWLPKDRLTHSFTYHLFTQHLSVRRLLWTCITDYKGQRCLSSGAYILVEGKAV